MIVLLGVLSVLLPFLIGFGILSVFYRKEDAYRVTVSESYLLGMICLFGLTQILHTAGLQKNASLQEISMVFAGGVIISAAAALAAGIGIFLKSGKKRRFVSACGQKVWGLPLLFGALLLIQIFWILSEEAPVTAGDITLETVQSFLAQDGIYRVMPLTGTASEQGMPLRYTLLCLPTLYAVLCQLFSTDPECLVTKIVPVLVLCAAYFAYYRLSVALWEEDQKKERFLFLTAVAFLLLVSDRAVYLDGYSALHSAYLGTAVRNLVLIPYTLSALLQKQWWKAVLCILAEACMVWTFWGCGVCLVLTAGMVFLTIADRKCPFLHHLLQVFRKKEELS